MLKKILISCFFVCMFLSPVAASPVRYKTLNINGNIYKLEIADTQEKREAGLSGRTLEQNEGMLFVLEEPCRPYFWMKGCLEPLDMIWVDEEGFVTEMDESARVCSGLDCIIYMPLHDTKYVVELKGGTAERIGIKIGQKLDI